jgi:hypothetical protein
LHGKGFIILSNTASAQYKICLLNIIVHVVFVKHDKDKVKSAQKT